MKKQIFIKILIAINLLIFNILGCINSAYATVSINSARVYSIGDCGNLLTYKGTEVESNYVIYTYNGVNYPAYCMNKYKTGANSTGYEVSIQNYMNDVGLWKVIINGYPYKSLSDLGVANKEEAFLATKQAIYCYIYPDLNKLSDYEPIGDAGTRVKKAMEKILTNASNSTETMISSTIKINKLSSEWKQDEAEKQYVSKTYSVSAGANIQNYKITLSRDNEKDLEGIKITDLNNTEKNEFVPNEKFKVLVPIKIMNAKGDFNLQVEAKINTKPILYGIAPDGGSQDYALTGASYEDGTGNTKDEYTKNETKIIIIKQDKQTQEKLEGVEFELLDENQNVMYSNLKTDSEGKIEIENLVPGRYYIRETNEKDGYQKYENLVKVDVELNEQVTVKVNNKKEDKPTIETNKKSVVTKQKTLPVTGM